VKTARTYATCAFVAVLQSAAWSAPQPYRVAAEPAWVQVADDAPLAAATAPVERGDADYLLVDHQVRLTHVTTHYTRFVERLVSQASVDAGAQISIEIDPDHERVLLHEVRVFRAGRVLDKLRDARKSLLNREAGLDEGLINGRVTLHVLLRDVRVGDVLDYAYSVERTDPIRERGYNEWFSTQWSTPVRRFRLRVVRPQDRPLQIKDESQFAAPAQARNGEWLETVWDAHDIKPLPDEAQRPKWFFYYPRIEISEFADWNAVRNWAIPLYAVKAGPSAEMRELLAELAAEPAPAARILKAVRFVQDDIRYTGLEIGAGAYRPTQPDVVLARRYGDCKDKVLLLVTLLRALGVEATPALVNAGHGRGIAERLPMPSAFDHVIARIHWNDRDYWVDATASGQGGALETLVQADFGLALVLDAKAGALEPIPPREGKAAASHVLETYDFRKGTDKAVSFSVQTEYRDEQADDMRVRLRTVTATQIGKDYLDYYRKTYSGIRAVKPLGIEDDRAANLLTLDESYEIDTPFEKDDEGTRQFYMEAFLITDRTGIPKETVRTTPLARSFPLHVRHEIVAYLPGKWDITTANVAISDPAFEYTSKGKFHDGKLELAYELHNTADHVPLANLKSFLAQLDKAHDDAFYRLTDGEEAPAPVVQPAARPAGPSIEMIVTLLLGLGVGVAVSLALARVPWQLPAAESDAPVGFGGWLVLPILGALITPFLMSFNIWKWFGDIGTAEQFDGIATKVQAFLLLEFLTISALLVMSLFTLWFMFRRLRSFPFAFIVLHSGGLLMLVLDLIAIWLQGDHLAKERHQAVVALSTRGVSSLLWITYMAVSQRVRATFIRPERASDLPAAAAPAPVLVPGAIGA